MTWLEAGSASRYRPRSSVIRRNWTSSSQLFPISSKASAPLVLDDVRLHSEIAGASGPPSASCNLPGSGGEPMLDIRRRGFITLLGGAAAAWPLGARAQQSERVRRIGVLTSGATADDPDGRVRTSAFLQGLQQSGWIDGRNIRIDYRWGA